MITHVKPCPWCGHQPERKYLHHGKEYVACVNPKCHVNPITDAYSTKAQQCELGILERLTMSN